MTKTRNLHFALAGALVIAGLTLTTNARAAGFAVAENSAKGLGRAFAGAARRGRRRFDRLLQPGRDDLS